MPVYPYSTERDHTKPQHQATFATPTHFWPMPVNTRELAKIADVAEQTVRNYSRDYAELLSPKARGDLGARLFDDEDVRVFCSIVALRRDGLPAAEVVKRIKGGDIFINTTPHQATPNATPSPQTALEAPQLLFAVRSDLQRQIDEMRHAQRSQAKRLLWSHGIAFWLGMVTMGVVFYVVWLMVNGW